MVNPSVIVDKCNEGRADNGDVMNAINIQGGNAVASAERMGLNAGDRAERLGLENLRAHAQELAAIKDAAILSVKEFGDVKLDMAKELARVALEMEKCCCETRALVVEKSNQTDALLRQLDAERVKTELANVRLQLLVLQATTGTPVVPPAA